LAIADTGAVTPRGAVLGDAGTVSLALSTHLPSPGGDPDQYEEEQSGKHIAGVYIFEAGPAGWTGIEDCPLALLPITPLSEAISPALRWVQWPSLRCDEPDPRMSIPAVTHRNIAGRSSSHSRHYDPALQEQVKPPGTRLIALRAGAFVVLLIARHRPDIARR
jgi:hypothetical protein